MRRQIVDACREIIVEDYGIELTWTDVINLKQYLDFFPLTDALFAFMSDRFGLDMYTVGHAYCPQTDIFVGMDLLGEENFKEFCRRRVNFWRERSEARYEDIKS